MRLKLTLAYDGFPFAGWQSQPQPEIRTVQGEIHRVLETIAKRPVKIYGSGRTDNGVHAIGQVAHFDAPAEIDMNPFNWLPAMNAQLPPEIRVMSCEQVNKDFHARHSAKKKTYTYRLSLAPVLPPHNAHRAWHLPRQLDPDTLDEALQLMTGSHDFRHLSALRGNENVKTEYERNILSASRAVLDDGYLLTFVGEGFLYKMVRFMTSAAVNASQGRLRLDDLENLLDRPELPVNRKVPCAPADGLTLHSVTY